jgi:hypothetical protein
MMASEPKGQALNNAPSYGRKIGERVCAFKSIRDLIENIFHSALRVTASDRKSVGDCQKIAGHQAR